MKKRILLICLLYLISGCSAKNNEKENETLEALKLDVVKKDNCENEISEYYEYNNRKVYFVCLNEVKLVEKPQTLSYYFNQASSSFEDKIKAIKTNLKEVNELNDGGTKIYKSKNMTLIECHRAKASKTNTDIYIGDENLEFNESFCSNK